MAPRFVGELQEAQVFDRIHIVAVGDPMTPPPAVTAVKLDVVLALKSTDTQQLPTNSMARGARREAVVGMCEK